MAALATEKIALTEFCDRKKIPTGMQRTYFEQHVRFELGNFNLRTADEWEQAYKQFQLQDRRRRA